jgi:large subunit ribosomal protein L25
MKIDTVVEVYRREEFGKGAAKRMRREGKIPGIVYGMELDPFAIAVTRKSMDEVLGLETGRNTIFSLSLAGSKEQSKRAVMIKDLQRDPVSEYLMHVDFVRVDLEKTVQVNVPIRLVGTSEGVKNEGGMLDFVQRTVLVECLPVNIPDALEVDISGLHLNQHAAVKDLEIPDNVKVLDEADTPLASVAILRGAVEEAAAEEAEEEEGKEPEVEGKGKEEVEPEKTEGES